MKMRKHTAAFLLAGLGMGRRLLSLLLGMAALEGCLFFLALRRYAGREYGLEQVFSRSGAAYVCGAGFLALCALLSLRHASGGGKPVYRLETLPFSARTAVVWTGVYNTLCFFLFWAAQLLIALALCGCFVRQAPAETVSGQTVALAFYRSGFLHSLLPLAESSRYIRNAALILGLGVSSACFSHRLRNGKKGMAVVILAAATAVFFPAEMGSLAGDVCLGLLALLAASAALVKVLMEKEA